MEDQTKERMRCLLGFIGSEPEPSKDALVAEFTRVRDELVQQKIWLQKSIDLFNSLAALKELPPDVYVIGWGKLPARIR
jgi:hypothetical protein